MPGHDIQLDITILIWCEEMDLWEDRGSRYIPVGNTWDWSIMHFSLGEDVALNLVQEPVFDIYKHSLEWKHTECVKSVWKVIYTQRIKGRQEMKALRPSKTLLWADSTICGYMPRASLQHFNRETAKVTSGPVLHSHLASSGSSYIPWSINWELTV